MAACEPCQDRKVAALSRYRHVPRGCLLLQLYKEIGRQPGLFRAVFLLPDRWPRRTGPFIAAGTEFLYNNKVM